MDQENHKQWHRSNHITLPVKRYGCDFILFLHTFYSQVRCSGDIMRGYSLKLWFIEWVNIEKEVPPHSPPPKKKTILDSRCSLLKTGLLWHLGFLFIVIFLKLMALFFPLPSGRATWFSTQNTCRMDTVDPAINPDLILQHPAISSTQTE